MPTPARTSYTAPVRILSFADRDSGSSDVGLALLDQLSLRVEQDVSTTPLALQKSLLEWLREAQAVQPSMGLVHQLAARALSVARTSLERELGVADARRELQASFDVERTDLAASRAAVARQATQLISERGTWIATLSSSSAVRDALLLAAEAGREPRVLIGESRPRLEGRRLAATLAERKIPAWTVADAALPMLLSQAGMVWLGADAVTDQGVLNKIGSYAAALAAREHSVPVYALASTRKFLPATTKALRIVEMPPHEVWDKPPQGVRPRNVYFEVVPLPLFRGVVAEDSVLPPGEAAAVARERALPEELVQEP